MRTSIRVLMVEDSEDDGALVTLLLRQAGFELHSERVDTARELAKALANRWDVIISDHSMPHFSGPDALKMVRAHDPEVPFIFVSGTIGEDFAADAMRTGAQDYVMKSNLKRLVPAVERELRESHTRRERKNLDRRIQQLEKFEAIGRLVGGVAHDFNNMIGAILGWAEMGLSDAAEDSRARDRFHKIYDQSMRAGKLTGQLLAFAGGQILEPTKLNINTLVQEEMSLLSRIIGADIKVKIHIDPDLRVTMADPSQIEQVLMNLCLNARDAVPNGGEILIETRNVELDARFCTEHAFDKPGSYILISVTDNGTGIDSASLDHIFEPFFTTKGPGKGTGLGLATVYGIVKQHGGFIFAQSRPDQGTTFRVYLPANAGEHAAPEVAQQCEPPGGTETILLAEDHEGLRTTAQEMLKKLGYSVIVAADGKESVELFKSNHHIIDLVVMDVVMPQLSGPEAYLEMCLLCAGCPDPKVIFTTGYTPKAKDLAAMVEKGAAILRKPYSLISLSQMIRGALEREPALHSA